MEQDKLIFEEKGIYIGIYTYGDVITKKMKIHTTIGDKKEYETLEDLMRQPINVIHPIRIYKYCSDIKDFVRVDEYHNIYHKYLSYIDNKLKELEKKYDKLRERNEILEKEIDLFM